MNLHQILLILRARYRLILLMLLMTVGAALAVSLYLPKQYIATSAVVVDVKSPDPVIGVYLPAISMPGYMATQVDILNSVRVAQKVVKLTQQDKDAKAMADWQAATAGKGSFEVWLLIWSLSCGPLDVGGWGSLPPGLFPVSRLACRRATLSS